MYSSFSFNYCACPLAFDIVKSNVSIFSCCADDKGCSYCSGLGHRITECPKLEAIQQQAASKIGRKDYIAESAADW